MLTTSQYIKRTTPFLFLIVNFVFNYLFSISIQQSNDLLFYIPVQCFMYMYIHVECFMASLGQFLKTPCVISFEYLVKDKSFNNMAFLFLPF